MDLLLRGLGVLLFFCGLPGFLGMAAVLGTFTAMEIGQPGQPPRDDQMWKFTACYGTLALSALVTAAGAALWALASIAYARKANVPATALTAG